jgi:hypothetical protein
MKGTKSIKGLLKVALLLLMSTVTFVQGNDVSWENLFNSKNMDGWKMALR